MSKIQCTVGMLSFNSRETLRRALESIQDFAEIIICDGGSTDNTLDIAREFGCKIISQDKVFTREDGTIKDFSGVRNQCLDVATHDWFFYLDSDETMSGGLKKEIQEIINDDNEVGVYSIPIKMIVNGKLIKYSSNYPGYQNRFFNRKTGSRFIKTVHERIEYDKEVYTTKKLQNPWLVYWDKDRVDNYAKYSDKYIRIEVEKNKNQTLKNYLKYAVRGNFITILKITIKSLRNYIFYGFKDTMPVKVEIGRISYIVKLMASLTIARVK